MKKKNNCGNLYKRAVFFMALVLTAACLFSCAWMERTRDEAAVKDMVMRYNRDIINAAKTGDTKALAGMASEDILRKLYYWIAAWRDSGAYMDGALKDITFKKIDISDQTAKVLTTEDWLYSYRDIKTKKILVPDTAIVYEMEYILLKKDGRWIIMAINIKSEKK